MPGGALGDCVACGGPLELFGPRQDFEYCRCRHCRSLMLHPMPTSSQLAEAYAHHYADAHQTKEIADPEVCARAARRYYQSLARTLRDHRVAGLVVDYGAGWGELSRLLTDEGFQCLAVEASRRMAAHCQQGGLPVRCGDLSVIEDLRGAISAFVMCTVFEHLVDHDQWLQGMSRLLKKNGVVISLHPTAAAYRLLSQLVRLGNRRRELPEFHGTFSPPWHTTLFSVEGMQRLVQRNGFEMVEVRPAPQGRLDGPARYAQICLESVNRIGWMLLREDWPLLTSHIFVFRKVG